MGRTGSIRLPWRNLGLLRLRVRLKRGVQLGQPALVYGVRVGRDHFRDGFLGPAGLRRDHGIGNPFRTFRYQHP
jgi:hypothetical protein